MYKFITIRCTCCSSVIYNLPEKETQRLTLGGLTCEDCEHTEYDALGIFPKESK